MGFAGALCYRSAPMIELTATGARNIAIRAQGFAADSRPAGAGAMLDHLGAVQLDTISVLARSHELVAYARLGPIGREAIEAAYWKDDRAFEYFGHAACVLPMALWPYFAFRRRAWQARTARNAIDGGIANAQRSIPEAAEVEVRARLADGPVTVGDVGGGRSSPGWWNWSEAKLVLELLYLRGEAVCVTRNGWKRVYDLAERAIPADLLAQEPDDAACTNALIAEAARVLGVATRRDLARHWYFDYPNINGTVRWRDAVERGIEAAGLVEVAVEGWGEPAFAHPAALATAGHEVEHRPVLLSPFDSLIWAPRERTQRLFGFAYQFEAYVPKAKRMHGYFTMPLLAGGRLVGRVDPAREGRTLIARQLILEEPEAVEPLAAALREAAAWVNCDAVRVESIEPKAARRPLTRLLK